MLLSTLEWDLPGCNARIAKKEPDVYYLEYSGIDFKTFDSFSGNVYIRKCYEACLVGKWIAVPQNPFNIRHDTKVIKGGSAKIAAKKVLRQIEKWKEEAEKKSGKKQTEHKVPEQYTGDEDILPFC